MHQSSTRTPTDRGWRDQPEPRSACLLPGTKRLADIRDLAGPWYVHCGGRNDRAFAEPFVSTLATLPFTALWSAPPLNRNSRIVGQDRILLSMQMFESVPLPLPCEREIFVVS
jgi:hypothetical protein